MGTLCLAKFIHGHAIIYLLFANYTPAYYCRDTSIHPSELIQYNNSCNSRHADGPMYCYYEKGKHQPESDYETIPTQFALTCDRAWINPLMTSINRGGYMIGALLSTWLVKYFGLRDPLMVILFINGLIFISLGFTTDIMLVCFLRLVNGVFGGGRL